MPINAHFTGTQNAGRRNQMKTGTITVGGQTFKFRSGGHGRGNLPAGNYTVTKHMMNRNTKGMVVGGVGYSFAVSDKFDRRVGANRSALRIHPDGGSPGTQGCIGIVGDAATQKRFRAALAREIDAHGGRISMHVS